MKNIIILTSIIFCLTIFSCGNKKQQDTEYKDNIEITGKNFYRYYWGEKEGLKVWIVDGASIRKEIFNEFIYGGNDERYPFVPVGEIWIDNSISSEEFETTLSHEINERNLMLKNQWTYFDAHDSSLSLELSMRRKYLKESLEHENELPKVEPMDFDSTQEIPDIPDKIKLKNIYRIPLGNRNGINIWVVDGYAVRREIYPDFGFSGNDLAYHFIPKNEIWIDGAITCEETEYSIALETKERENMSKGMIYDDAYVKAVFEIDKLRQQNNSLILTQKKTKKTNPVVRDTGVFITK